MNTSPMLSALARGLGISVILAICTFLMIPGNDVAFGSYAGIVITLASLVDGFIEKQTGKTAFGSVK